MDARALHVGLACEDEAHAALAAFLTDRVLLDEARRDADWINGESLGWYRSFGGLTGAGEGPRYYSLKDARRDVEERGKRPTINGRPIRLAGHIDGKPLKPEAAFWRIVFTLFAAQSAPPDVLIVVRDTDGDERRLDGLKQALEFLKSFPEPLPVVVATPHQDAEAWFVVGFIPENKSEQLRLDALTAELSFSPTQQAHRLTAHPNDALTDAKRVLRMLVFDEDRSCPPSAEELPALCERTLHDLARLEEKGHLCRLSAFLRDLRAILVPRLIPERMAPHR